MAVNNRLILAAMAAAVALTPAVSSSATCATDSLPAERPGPNGFPEHALTMVVPYGPAGGSGQVARAMAQAVSELTGVSINRDHVPGESGNAGLSAYLATPADGYSVLEHIDDAASAHALEPELPNPAVALIPLVTSQITFSQIYIRGDEDRFTDWATFVDWVKAQEGRARIANVSREGSMERATMKFITDATDMQIQQISFDKAAPRYGALAGGQVDALFEQPGDVRRFLDTGKFKPILTILKQAPEAFADVPSLTDAGLNFEPLLRYRSFYVSADTPAERVEWLQWAFQKAFCQPGYQRFNESKFMTLIESFRDTAGTIELIDSTIEQYREVYRETGSEEK